MHNWLQRQSAIQRRWDHVTWTRITLMTMKTMKTFALRIYLLGLSCSHIRKELWCCSRREYSQLDYLLTKHQHLVIWTDLSENDTVQDVIVTGGYTEHVEGLKHLDLRNPEENGRIYKNWADSLKSFPGVFKEKVRESHVGLLSPETNSGWSKRLTHAIYRLMLCLCHLYITVTRWHCSLFYLVLYHAVLCVHTSRWVVLTSCGMVWCLSWPPSLSWWRRSSVRG